MLRKMRRLIGTAEHVTAIADGIIYRENENSYAGGALTDSNILVVSNMWESSNTIQLLNTALNIEKCKEIRKCFVSNSNNTDCLVGAIEENKERGFNHIINWIEIVSDDCIAAYKCDMQLLYYIMQIECNYFVSNSSNGTICTILIDSGQADIMSEAEIGGMKSLIKGLGYRMPKHKVIINGAIVYKDVPLKEVVPVAIYLSSKYGQILTGEVLIMGNKR